MSSSSDISRAKVNYEGDNFVVEFNVAEYKPEVRQMYALMTCTLWHSTDRQIKIFQL